MPSSKWNRWMERIVPYLAAMVCRIYVVQAPYGRRLAGIRQSENRVLRKWQNLRNF
jgi:hypothetical protein